MSIILIGNQKGGTGKTTIAFNLAVMRSRRKKVLVIDTDPQRSLVDLFKIRKIKPMPYDVFYADGSTIHGGIKDIKNDFDTIIIDAAGRDTDSLKSSLLAADTFLIPFRPSRLDLLAMANINDLTAVTKEFNPELKVRAVLSMCSTHFLEKESKQAIFEFKKFGEIKLLNIKIRDRAIYRQSLNDGLAIIEGRNKKAIQEIQQLYKEVF